ncbi:MAG TPA: hypothetical protein VLE96_02235 [Chlamydiales bacterium]|nr:hypothetical protein [Chlamydiales bacterium]
MKSLLFLIVFAIELLHAEASGQIPIEEEEITYDWLVSQSPNGGYTDYIPHFNEIFKHYKVKTLLEFGMGYSTKYFLRNLKKVISVEFVTYGAGPMWLHKLLQLYKNDLNWIPIAYLSNAPYDTSKIPFKFFGTDALYKADSFQCSTHLSYSLFDPSYLKELNTFFGNLLKCHSVDCALVDSGSCLRGDYVSLLFSRISVIVAHDTHCREKKEKGDVYGYSRIVTPPDYEEICIPFGEGTTIWIKKDPALEQLTNAMRAYAQTFEEKK